MAFPNLKPSSRSYEPGSYPIKTFKAQNGAERRILYGTERTEVKLSLSYANIGDANAELFLDHYDEVQGTFQTFGIPQNALAGWGGNIDALRPEPTEVNRMLPMQGTLCGFQQQVTERMAVERNIQLA
jgi:hypothetical protein